MATLASVAHAQSNVSVFGLLDVSVGRTQAPGGAASNAMNSGKMTTSHLGFRGVEDLGGGVSTVFALEQFLRPDTGSAGRFNGDTFWARNAYLGFNGGFGSFQMGRITTPLFVNTLRFNPFGDSFGFSPSIRHYFASGTVTGDTGWSESALYTSPKFGNLTLQAHGAFSGGDGGSNSGLSAQYFDGPVGLAANWQKVRKGATTADTTTWQLSGSYDFKLAKVFLQHGRVDNDTTGNEYKITGIGASIPVGEPGKILMQWGQIDPKSGAKRTTVSVGYDHNLSKRTDVYGVYMSDKLSGLRCTSSYLSPQSRSQRPGMWPGGSLAALRIERDHRDVIPVACLA